MTATEQTVRPQVDSGPDEAGKFFVEIGANTFETLLPLARRGWRGICVEPVKYYFSRLERLPGVIYENVAITESEGETTLYRLPEELIKQQKFPNWAHGLASLSPKHPMIVASKLEDHLISEIVPCTRLDTLLEKHGVTQIDFLKIDVEGFDFQVLQTMDFSIQPALIKIEHKHMPPEDKKGCMELLQSHGYWLTEEFNDFYAIR